LNLLKLLPPSAEAHPFQSKGLMHRKIIVLDQVQVFLGTANLTTTSLKHHSNLLLGIYSPLLGQFLSEKKGTYLSFSIEGQPAKLWLLPDEKQSALKQLLMTIDDAQTSIRLAMYTLTHPLIADALIRAKERGVDVKVALDLYTAKGASRNVVTQLERAEIPILLSRGQEL
jgi:phosphatidylserine/phosphatidylglycerophosphate/cardiolipin synthase-like enzyme